MRPMVMPSRVCPVMPVWMALGTVHKGHALTPQAIADMRLAHLGTRKVHTTRHTFAHSMEALGAKVSDIQARLGHSSLASSGKPGIFGSPLEPFPQGKVRWFVRCSLKKGFRCSPPLKPQNHPQTAPGRRGLSSVAGQPISDLSSLTPAGVTYGPLRRSEEHTSELQ